MKFQMGAYDVVKVVDGLKLNCPRCKESLISAEGKLPVIGLTDVLLHECGEDVSDIVRVMAGYKFFNVGTQSWSLKGGDELKLADKPLVKDLEWEAELKRRDGHYDTD